MPENTSRLIARVISFDIDFFVLLATFAVLFGSSAFGENSSFIVADGTLLKTVDKGRPWFYAGTNNYYVGIDNTSTAVVDEIISDMSAMNLNVIRIWGFNDDQGKSTRLQGPDAGDFIEANFLMLDYVLHRANQNDIRVILPLTNNWGDYGGMEQYVDWNGGGSKDDFYINSGAQTDYCNFISHLANRVNTYNGRIYKNDPTILAWQLANEPRYSTDPTVSNGSALSAWINSTAAYLKNTVGVQQLVTTGMEGFYDTGNSLKGGKSWMDNEGTGFILQHAGPNIDITGFHLYPDHWSLTDTQCIRWITHHIRDARRDGSLGKPVIMDEFGRQVPPNTMEQRNESFKNYLKTANREMVNGTNFWILYHDSYGNYDSFGVYYPADSNTIEVIKDYTGKINFLNETGIHQLLSFEYDDDGFTKTGLEGGEVYSIDQVETPSWDLTGDGAVEISCSFSTSGDKATIGAELKDPITGLAGIDVSDYGYQYIVARVMVEDSDNFEPCDLNIKLYNKTGSGWTYNSNSGLDIIEAGFWYELSWPVAGSGDLTDLKEIGIDICANDAYTGNIYVDFVGGDLTNLSDNPAPEPEVKIFYTTNELIDLMDWDYGDGAISAMDTSAANGAVFSIDGPQSGAGWWDIGICWADPDLYPPAMDLSEYGAAAIRVKNLAETGVVVKMYINFGWDHTGGGTTIESNPWTILSSGEMRLFVMGFEDYDIDRPNEIVKIGVHLGMNGPDDDPNGYYPIGSRMRVLVTGLPAGGDFEPDGDVDFRDFAVLALSWQSSEGFRNWNPDCDIAEPNDGIIDERDLSVFVDNWLEVVD